MLILFCLSAFCVLVFSLAIAFRARQSTPRREGVWPYLFGHNSWPLATSSNIGSILALSWVVCTMLPALAGFGYVPVYGLYLGVVIGYVLFGLTIRRIHRRGLLSAVVPASGGSSYRLLDLVDAPSQHLFRRVQTLFYCVLLAMEIAIAQRVLTAILDSYLVAALAMGMVVFLCCTYTSVGGFIGVLRTDLFQLLIVLVGCTLLTIQSFDSVRANLGHTIRFYYFALDDPVLFLAFLAIFVAYFFSFPDLWIRNIGTLRAKDGGPELKPLWLGGLGVVVVTIPIVLIGASLLAREGKTGSMDIQPVLDLLSSTLSDPSFLEGRSFALWWVLGGAVCVFVTTIDTQLIGLSQHSFLGKRTDLLVVQRRPYLFGCLALLGSYPLSNMTVWWICGMVAILIMFGNAMVLLLLAFPPRSGYVVKKHLLVYLSVGGAMTVVAVLYFWGHLDENLQWVGLFQAVLAIAIMFVPLKLRELSRRVLKR